jgi:aminomethyltransferase
LSEPQRTPLYDAHLRLGARMVDFAGFEMPIQYDSILEEHAAVRKAAGLFDVSHMGQIHLRGSGAIASGEQLVSCPVASLGVGRVRYGLLCNDAGGVVDDVTLYRLSENELLFCVNASNIEKDHRWICEHVHSDTEVENRSAETGLLALQGPLSAEILAAVSADPKVQEIKRFRFAHHNVAGVPSLISRTGYTGSDGFEIYLPGSRTEEVFEALLDAGRAGGLQPAGLGARDTLRLEAALPLYGHELDDTTSPLEAGLDRFVKRAEAGFVGAEAIEARAASVPSRQLVGFEVTGRGVARAGYALSHNGAPAGHVTSGAPSPTCGVPIGLGYVRPEAADIGNLLEVDIRGRAIEARVVKTPFVERGGRSTAQK